MDYRKIRVSFLDNKEINKNADLFRKKHLNKLVPVDMEEIIEIKLKISLAPIPNLQNSFGVDAFITSNWQLIYVDRVSYLDERFQNRLRFSLAHEIGHFVLHKNIYSGFNIKKVEDFYKLFKDIPQEQYGYLETQANKFANYLLVPRDRLVIEREKVLEMMKRQSVQIEELDKQTLNSYMAIPVSKTFGVSDEVVQIALNDLNNRE